VSRISGINGSRAWWINLSNIVSTGRFDTAVSYNHSGCTRCYAELSNIMEIIDRCWSRVCHRPNSYVIQVSDLQPITDDKHIGYTPITHTSLKTPLHMKTNWSTPEPLGSSQLHATAPEPSSNCQNHLLRPSPPWYPSLPNQSIAAALKTSE